MAGLALLALGACSDSDYDDKYEDPSKTTTVGVGQGLTALMYNGNTCHNIKYYV